MLRSPSFITEEWWSLEHFSHQECSALGEQFHNPLPLLQRLAIFGCFVYGTGRASREWATFKNSNLPHYFPCSSEYSNVSECGNEAKLGYLEAKRAVNIMQTRSIFGFNPVGPVEQILGLRHPNEGIFFHGRNHLNERIFGSFSGSSSHNINDICVFQRKQY